MPPDLHHHNHNHNLTVKSSSPKPNQNFLSLILKALIMIFITSLFFIFVGVAAILFLCLAGEALHRRRRRGGGETRPLNSTCGFSPRDLRRLPQFRCRNGTEGECVVCLDGFRENQWCRRLVACDHVFHRRCLDSWLVKVPACPICRTRVGLDFGDTVSSSSSLDLAEEAKQWWGFNE
uniref:RING-type domain-containing protein n=1 Tax=Cannabis sativa TaxID=3483 RepID=A0A803QAN2_CANSA